MTAGWIGTRGQMLHALQTFGVDTDEEGKILIKNGLPFSFLGIDQGDETEVLLPGDIECFIAGKPVSIASLMRQTSYGCRVNVIC